MLLPLHAVALFIILFVWIYPALLEPFVGLLPYLHTKAFGERFIWSVLLTILCAICAYFGATAKNKRFAMSMISGWKEIGLLVSGLFMFTYFSAVDSANTLGSLVMVFPAEPYHSQFRVIGMEFSGTRKKRSVDLKLKSSQDGNIYYLTLSQNFFDDRKFQHGDTVVVDGKQNSIGVYVESIELQRKKE